MTEAVACRNCSVIYLGARVRVLVAGTDFFFLPGVIMVLIQSGNTDLSARVYAWERQGRTGRKPRYNWFLPFNVSRMELWIEVTAMKKSRHSAPGTCMALHELFLNVH